MPAEVELLCRSQRPGELRLAVELRKNARNLDWKTNHLTPPYRALASRLCGDASWTLYAFDSSLAFGANQITIIPSA